MNCFPVYRSKAVADGAVAYYHDHNVSVRVARTTFGTECSVAFDRTNPAHLRRAHSVIHLPSGQRLPEAFDVILKKVSPSLSLFGNCW